MTEEIRRRRCLNLLLNISKHFFVIFPVLEMKTLNRIEFSEIPTYVNFNLS